MLNQCIFIGKISEVIKDQENVKKIVLDVTSTNLSTDKISIELPFEMTMNQGFNEGNTVAIKARVTSSDAITYHFIAERMTILGGRSHE